jgi:hypothetical protein
MRGGSRISRGERWAGRGVEPRDEASLFRGAKGGADTSGRLGRRRHGSQNAGMAAGVKPEAAKRCGTSPRALRATTVPVRLNIDGNGVFPVESATDFVADGAENAGHDGAFAIGGHRP